jgi:hypothetical protein
LTSFFEKAICKTPSQNYFLARTIVINEMINYFDTVLTEVSDRRVALAEADPLER